MAEHRDASRVAIHRCGKGKRARGFVLDAHKCCKVKEKDGSIRDTQQKAQRTEDISRQPWVVFDALAPSDLQTHGCQSLTKHTLTDTNGTRQARQDGPGDKFPPGRPHTPASSTPLCPQAFPGWPIEWVTYPDSNTLWQRDLETDVSCHWHGADEEMVSLVHAVYLSVRTEGGRESGRLAGDVGRKEERRRRWRVRAAVVVEGCKRRNKSSQSNLWQWLLQYH